MADIKTQAEFDASIAEIEKNKQLNQDYYNAFKQTIKNRNTQYDILSGQINQIKNDPNLSENEKLQKELEIRKGPMSEINSSTIADSKTYFMQVSDLPPTPDPNRTSNLKNMADNLVLQQKAIDANDKKIAQLESKLGTPNDSTSNTIPEKEAAPKTAENKVQDDTPPVTNNASNNADTATTNETKTPGFFVTKLNKDSVGSLEPVTVTATIKKQKDLSKRPYNPLSKFSSYTYNISLYALTPEAYNSWNVNGKWITKDLSLLIQSGGINKTLDGPRNEYFDLDFYIDDLEIVSLINAKSTMAAGNQSNFKFKVYEPFGVTFPTRLTKAQTKIQQQSNIKADELQQIQALQVPLLIVIKFYGYDEHGKLVKNLSDPNVNGYTKTDMNANFERAFPIIISKLSFKIEGKVTTYDIEAKMCNENVAFGSKKATVKTGFQITADTVKNAITSLLDKINAQQKELTKQPKDPKAKPAQEIADVYKIVFEDKTGIGDALIVDQDFYVKNYTPMAPVTKANQVNDRTAYSGKALTVKKDNRIVKIAEGTHILTVIEQIITQSTFIKDGLEKLEKEEIKKIQSQDSSVISKSSDLDLYWFKIRPSVKIIGYDHQRNDYAHEIVYNVIKYRIPHIQTLYLNRELKYHGPHKIYEYYYSGNNTEILDYNCTFNLLYYNLGALSTTASKQDKPNDPVPNSFEPGQNADSTNKLPMSNEIVNSLKTYLSSPADLLNATITILGDPDYLMPTEAGDASTMFQLFYGNDFTINPNSGEVFIEIGFKQGEDYFLEDGLLVPEDDIVFWIYPQGSDIEKQTEGRMVYMVKEVVSRFSNGVFKQELKLIIPSFVDQKKGEVEKKVEKRETKPVPKLPAAPANTGYDSTKKYGTILGVQPKKFDQPPPDDNLAKGALNNKTGVPGPIVEKVFTDPLREAQNRNVKNLRLPVTGGIFNKK